MQLPFLKAFATNSTHEHSLHGGVAVSFAAAGGGATVLRDLSGTENDEGGEPTDLAGDRVDEETDEDEEEVDVLDPPPSAISRFFASFAINSLAPPAGRIAGPRDATAADAARGFVSTSGTSFVSITSSFSKSSLLVSLSLVPAVLGRGGGATETFSASFSFSFSVSLMLLRPDGGGAAAGAVAATAEPR